MVVFIVQVFMLGVFVEQWSTYAQEHIGCFRSTESQPILSKPVLIPVEDKITVTIDICITRCRTELGTTYAGIIRGFYCRCGDSHQHEINGQQLNDSSCATKCPGDSQRKCRGDSSIVIYSVCNQNRYRDITNVMDNCDASCHCMDLQACTYSNGSCPAGCEPGWSSAICNVRNFTSVAGDQSPMANAVTHSASTGGTGADPASLKDTPVTTIAVGVSVAVVCLFAVAALIVYFRKPKHPCKSGDDRIEDASIQQVTVCANHNKGDLETQQSENGPTYVPSVSSPELNYSTVVFANSSPVCDDGKDIIKAGDIIIHGNHEKVEYAVVMRTTVTDHANLQDNSLYGTHSEDTDDNEDNSYKG